MNTHALTRPLDTSEIEFRIQSINNGGYATILAYKDARVDMKRLDEAFGVLGWKREHVNSNKNCIVSAWDYERKHWVSKEDTGTESMAEKEKGLASDSFKRACFNWGIGRELYDYPIVSVKLNDNEWEKVEGRGANKQTWNLKLKEWKWLSQFEDGVLTALFAKDQNGIIRFKYGEYKKEVV